MRSPWADSKHGSVTLIALCQVAAMALWFSASAVVPALAAEDIRPGGAGVRAQAVTAEGALVDDFRIVQTADAVHVLNAPSPAATASLAIGRHIATIAAETFQIATRT